MSRSSMPPKGGNRSGQQKRRQNGQRSVSDALKRAMYGRVIKNQPDPSTFVASPWNQLVVAFRWSTSAARQRDVLTVADVANGIIGQIGLLAGSLLQVRMQGIKAWSNDNTDYLSILNMDIFDIINTQITDTNNRLLTTISDVSGKNHFANVGYQYPSTQRDVVLTNNGSTLNAYILATDVGPNNEVLVYVKVLWRPVPPMNPFDDGPDGISKVLASPQLLRLGV